jgi:hypothetical protein
LWVGVGLVWCGGLLLIYLALTHNNLGLDLVV